MMKLFVNLIWLTLARGFLTSAQNKIPKIGIIGGGIGGTSCAFFLKSLFGEDGVEIDLFEAEKVGGRLSVVRFSGFEYEEGGSIIHPRNEYMVKFLNIFGLKRREPSENYFALYDGKDYVFSESSWRLVTLASFLRRYGFGFWKLKNHIEDMLRSFEKIYGLQAAGKVYPTVEAMLAAMDPKFPEYLRMSTKSGFEKEGFSKLMIEEIIMACIRVNYGQDLHLHKMVGSVSLAGVTDSVWSVSGGNVKIPENLLKASKANLVNLSVISVRRTSSGQMEIKAKAGSNGDEEGEGEEEGESRLYDVVILAAPQTSEQKHKIRFENFEEEIRFAGRYHKTVCTLVEGDLAEDFLRKNPIADEIFTTKPEVPFNSIGRILPVDCAPPTGRGASATWKVFTQERMSDALLAKLFSGVRGTHVREWLAYPHYGHSPRNDSFVLAPHLYHVNAIEWAASAMEMSAIGAKNVALLAHRDWMSRGREADCPGAPKPFGGPDEL